MTCVSPPELDDRELMTYIDAEAVTTGGDDGDLLSLVLPLLLGH